MPKQINSIRFLLYLPSRGNIGSEQERLDDSVVASRRFCLLTKPFTPLELIAFTRRMLKYRDEERNR